MVGYYGHLPFYTIADIIKKEGAGMKKKVVFVVVLLLVYGVLPQGSLFSQSISKDQIESFKQQFSGECLLFEDFDSIKIDRRLKHVDIGKVSNSGLTIQQDGEQLLFFDRRGFTQAIVCYKLTSRDGHLFIYTHLSEGHFALFNDALGHWAWKDFERGEKRFDCRGFGRPLAANTGKWILHEMRIEDGNLKYFINQKLLGEVPLSASAKMSRFGIAANCGGKGIVDFVILVGDEGYYLWSEDKLEVVIPPSPTQSAPFDTAVLSDGTIVMAGSEDRLVSVSLDGAIEPTEYPTGMNFEGDRNGVMWYYNFPDGRLYRWDPEKRRSEEVATLPAAYSDGTIAVSPDGETVYVGWWLGDKRKSALYRYRDSSGLEKLLERPADSMIRAVEVTVDGSVYVACTDGIYRLQPNDTLKPFHLFFNREIYIASDGLTSDQEYNLYFSAYSDEPGIFRLAMKGKLERIVRFKEGIDLPFGLSWHSQKNLILGVRKEKGEILSVDRRGNVNVLNDPSGLTTPIAIEEHPDGTVFINGDEIGLLTVEADKKVRIFCRGMCCYQPPPADFAFDRNGLIYYTCAAPGFRSELVTIDQNRRIRTLTQNVGSPAGIDSGSDGKIYYADYDRGTVNLLKKSGRSIAIIENLYFPLGLVIDEEDNFWVGTAEKGASSRTLGEVPSSRILKYDRRGNLLETIDFRDWGQVDITFFDVDKGGNLYVPMGNTLIRRNYNGSVEVMAQEFRHIRGAKVFSNGYLYFVDYGNPALYRLKIE